MPLVLRVFAMTFFSLLHLAIAALVLQSPCAIATTAQNDGSNPSSYDYLIVGGGTAGLVLANRLSSNPHVRVAVIEAGGSVLYNANVTNVTTYGLSLDTSIDWSYVSAPQEYDGKNGTLVYHAGKALGGTSTINGMTYLRAEKAQVDAWEEGLGNEGWSWDSLFPYYKKSEEFEAPTEEQVVEGGATWEPDAHGEEGPVTTGWSSYLMLQNASRILNETGNAMGYPWNEDANDGSMRGFTVWPFTLDARKDIRQDSARAYYWPVAAQRKNLVVYANTTVSKIVWKNGGEKDKKGNIVADGVEGITASGAIIHLTAKREVILSAGSIRSPAVLELSGVGNPNILTPLGINTTLSLPTVGENLQDQPNLPMLYFSNQNWTGYPSFVTYATAVDLFPSNTADFESSIRAKIPALVVEIAASSRNSTTAAIQEKLLNLQTDIIFGTSSPSTVPIAELLWALGAGIVASPFWTLIPFSRGNIHITTANPLTPPSIDPKYWQSDIDISIQAAAARSLRKIFATEPLKNYVSTEVSPGFGVVPEDASDEVWGEWLKATCKSIFCLCI